MLKLPFLSRLRPRSGYDIVAVIALCAALGTGGAYAAATIGSEEVVDESLTDADIKNGSLTAAIADWSISSWKLKPSSVLTGHILDGSVSGYDVDESTLGKVPAAAAADHATTAQTAEKATTADSAAIAGYEVVSASVPFSHTVKRTGFVSCPPGKRVLGGSYWMHPVNDPYDSYWIPSKVMTRISDGNTKFRVAAEDVNLNYTIGGEPAFDLVIQATCAKVQ
jgi:hypothetical protein